MAYSAVELSKYIITKCARENKPISNLQLQKILYFIQKEYLQKKGVPAFNDPIEAWQFGPVVPRSYYRFCGYGGMPIHTEYVFDIEQNDKNIINPIVDEKCSLDPWDLVRETHKSGSAWDYIYDNGNGNHHVIPIDLIKLRG